MCKSERPSYWLLPQIEKADWWSYFCYIAYLQVAKAFFPWACYKYILLSFSITIFAQMINSFPWPTIIDHKVQIGSPVSEQWRRYLKNLPGVVAPSHTHPTIEISWKVVLTPWPNFIPGKLPLEPFVFKQLVFYSHSWKTLANRRATFVL